MKEAMRMFMQMKMNESAAEKAADPEMMSRRQNAADPEMMPRRQNAANPEMMSRGQNGGSAVAGDVRMQQSVPYRRYHSQRREQRKEQQKIANKRMFNIGISGGAQPNQKMETKSRVPWVQSRGPQSGDDVISSTTAAFSYWSLPTSQQKTFSTRSPTLQQLKNTSQSIYLQTPQRAVVSGLQGPYDTAITASNLARLAVKDPTKRAKRMTTPTMTKDKMDSKVTAHKGYQYISVPYQPYLSPICIALQALLNSLSSRFISTQNKTLIFNELFAFS